MKLSPRVFWLSTLVILGMNSLRAQWAETFLPVGPRITGLTATSDSGIFVLKDTTLGASTGTQYEGTEWYLVGVPNTVKFEKYVGQRLKFVVANSSIYVGSSNGLYRVTHSGSTWNVAAIQSYPGDASSLAVNGSTILAGNQAGLERSTDNGVTWNLVNTGLPASPISSLLINGTTVLAASYHNGVFTSTNNGTSWTGANAGLTTKIINCFAGTTAGTGAVYAGTDQGLFISTNNGSSWSLLTLGVSAHGGGQPAITSLVAAGAKLYAVADSIGIFVTSNNGLSWTDVTTDLPDPNVEAIVVTGTKLYAATRNCGLYRSDNDGGGWTSIPLDYYYDASRPPSRIGTGINSSPDGGSSIYVGTGYGIYHTTNNGTHWKLSSNGITHSDTWDMSDGRHTILQVKMPSALTFAFGPATGSSGEPLVFAGTDVGGVYVSRDGGMNWSAMNAGLPLAHIARGFSDNWYTGVNTLAINGSTLAAGLNNGRIYISTDNASTWNATNTLPPGDGVSALAFVPVPGDASRSYLLAGLRAYKDIYLSGGMYVSTNNGATWSASNVGLTDMDIRDFAVSGTMVVAGTASGVCISTDGGATWAPTSLFDSTFVRGGNQVLRVALSGSNIIVTTELNGVQISTDKGQTWTDINDKGIYYFARYARYVAVGLTDIWMLNADEPVNLYRRPLSDVIPKGSALSATLNEVDAGAFPQIKALITVQDAANAPISGLTSANFSVKEDGVTESPVAVAATGSTGAPVSVFILVDKGEIMARTGLSHAKAYASDFIELLQSTDSAGLLPFDNQTGPLTQFTANKTALLRGIELISPGDGAAIFDAVYEGINRLDRHNGSKALLLISAGQDKSTLHTQTEIFELIHRNGIPIYVIGFPSASADEDLLATLARISHGAYYRDPGKGGVSGIYESIAQAIKNQYQLTYTSHKPATDGSTRTVVVTTTYGNLSDVKQKQYAAPTSSSASSVVPTSAAVVPAGLPFWVEVKVGDPNTVKDLYGISFKLKTSLTSCTYVAGSATAGSFLGTGPLTFFQSPDAQTISATVTKTSAPGVNGSGIVARFQFTTPSSLSSITNITFTLSDVQANTSTGASIPMSLGSFTLSASPSASVWPGDCDNNGGVTAADVLPIGLYYGQKNATVSVANNPGIQWQAYKRTFWLSDSLGKKVYADADGNGVIDGADVLAVGLNYSKATMVVGKVGSSIALNNASGNLEISSVTRATNSRRRVQIPIVLNTDKPVYGISFALATGASEKFIAVDSTASLFGTALMVSKAADDLGIVDIGITSTSGSGFTGTGKLLTIELELPDNAATSVSYNISNISAVDARGNTVSISGKTYRGGVSETGQGSSIPTEYGLHQNYPNPFNPTTNFEFQVPSLAFVRLSVFDMLGREVARLVEGERAPGRYIARWDASSMSSGVYYYRMTATEKSGNTFTQTRRMALIK
jgi:VWFA-related protein